MIDHTHDAAARSWVESANGDDTPFPVQNLPYGIYRHPANKGEPRTGIAIGDEILDARACAENRGFAGQALEAANACGATLNGLVALSAAHSRSLRHALFDALTDPGAREGLRRCLFPACECTMELPVAIGDYTDFFCSAYHARNAGLIRGRKDPLAPNFFTLPVAYHGRASSVVVSGTPVRRPWGIFPDSRGAAPVFQPTRQLDFEVELATFARGGNALGSPIAIDEADDNIFGFAIQNDWSARDIQVWESQPLGPFLSKSFATTLSPWIVTREAMAPFVADLIGRPADAPPPLPHLTPRSGRVTTWAIELECSVTTERMRGEGMAGATVAVCSAHDMAWSPAQMLAHHTSNGCNLRPGDMFGSGTMSGPGPGTLGCLLELTRDGSVPLDLVGERRGYLDDGDEVAITGSCRAEGFRWIGFGAARGRIEAGL